MIDFLSLHHTETHRMKGGKPYHLVVQDIFDTVENSPSQYCGMFFKQSSHPWICFPYFSSELYVFVVGLKGGLYGFPSVYADKDIKRIILDIPIQEKEAEERRIFYVAMTRAKKKLFLIAEHNNKSEFLFDLPKDSIFEFPQKSEEPNIEYTQ